MKKGRHVPSTNEQSPIIHGILLLRLTLRVVCVCVCARVCVHMCAHVCDRVGRGRFRGCALVLPYVPSVDRHCRSVPLGILSDSIQETPLLNN